MGNYRSRDEPKGKNNVSDINVGNKIKRKL